MSRYYVPLAVGQVWRSSDPRRLSAFTITRIHADECVEATTVYPFPNDIRRSATRMLTVEDFYRLGSKGFMRVS